MLVALTWVFEKKKLLKMENIFGFSAKNTKDLS
jgi:hypothetical protein